MPCNLQTVSLPFSHPFSTPHTLHKNCCLLASAATIHVSAKTIAYFQAPRQLMPATVAGPSHTALCHTTHSQETHKLKNCTHTPAGTPTHTHTHTDSSTRCICLMKGKSGNPFGVFSALSPAICRCCCHCCCCFLMRAPHPATPTRPYFPYPNHYPAPLPFYICICLSSKEVIKYLESNLLTMLTTLPVPVSLSCVCVCACVCAYCLRGCACVCVPCPPTQTNATCFMFANCESIFHFSFLMTSPKRLYLYLCHCLCHCRHPPLTLPLQPAPAFRMLQLDPGPGLWSLLSGLRAT